MKLESAVSGGTYDGIGLERCSTSSAVLYRSDRTDTRPAVANLYFQTLQESWSNQYELLSFSLIEKTNLFHDVDKLLS